MFLEKNTFHQISEDRQIWSADKLVMYLHDCLANDTDAIIDFRLEGPCCLANGLYLVLDNFCDHTGYLKNRITIKTANMVEHHTEYKIKYIPEYWYEVSNIQEWLINTNIQDNKTPNKHFGNFVGRSTWNRLWISTLLDKHYSNKTLQTFHSSMSSNYVLKQQSELVDCLGLDELVSHKCNILPDVVKFLEKCPITINNDFDSIQKIKSEIVSQNDFYPIQHPANLNILYYYESIFVDIINETRTAGNCFFVSEKTWRCIVARRPFIIMGPQFFLTNLKKLGFKTFSDYWSEEYDDFPEESRVREIEQLIHNIATWDNQTLNEILIDMQHVLDYNFNKFKSLTYNDIRRVFTN